MYVSKELISPGKNLLIDLNNSSFQNIAVEAPSKRLDRDYSEPEYCTLQIKDNGDTVTAHIEAYDPDNYIQYYQVSLDGGDHFGRLEEWTDRSSTSMEFDIPKQIEQDYNVVVRAMNQYDLYLASDSVYVEGLPKPVEEEDIESIENCESSSENYFSYYTEGKQFKFDKYIDARDSVNNIFLTTNSDIFII